jgi:alpha-mannosidase
MSAHIAFLSVRVVVVLLLVCQSRMAPAQSQRKWEIYLLPHSHVDIGYTKLQTEVEADHWRFLEAAMEVVRQTDDYPPEAQFKWNVEVLWAVESFLKQAPPEKQRAFFDAVKEGRIGLDALYGNELTALCRPEELLRLVDYAVRLRRDHDVTIDSAMITDVAGYTWGIVPALAHGGVKYLSAGPNSSHRIGTARSAWDNRPFYWVAPCGRRKVLYWQTGNSYHPAFRNEAELLQFIQEFERNNTDYPYDMLYFRHCDGDNAGPDLKLSDFVRDWNDRHPSVKLIIATTGAMFRQFERRYGDIIPSLSGDFTPYWEDGAASSASETALNRAAAERLVQAETLWAMLRSGDYPVQEFDAAWRNVLLYDEHTWGAQSYFDVGRYPPGSAGYIAQWKIKQAFALDADAQSRKLMRDALSQERSNKVAATAVGVVNTCSWARTDVVTLPGELAVAGDVVRNAAGTEVPSQRLSTGALAFLAKDVPALATARYTIHGGSPKAAASARASGAILDNGSIALKLDQKTGAIASLTWKKLEADLVNENAGLGLNDFFHVSGKDPKDARGNGPVTISVKEQGPLVASLLIESDAPGCHALSREVRILADIDRVDIINLVDKRKIPLADLLKPNPTKESFHFGFAFNVPAGVMRMDVPWAVVRPDLDQLAGSCKNWFTVQRWIDVSNQDYGVTWATIDAPMVEVGAIAPQPENTHSHQGWIDLIGPAQTLYSYVMNNYWTTNYRHDQEGVKVFRYSIEPHLQRDISGAAAFGVERSQPLQVVPVDPDSPARGPLLSVQPKSVMVTALKPSQDGKAWIVRLFNTSAHTHQASLRWTAPRTTWLSNLAEERLGPITGPIDMASNEIVTLRSVRSASQ